LSLVVIFGTANTSRVIGWTNLLWNDLQCVKWVVKPYYAIQHSTMMILSCLAFVSVSHKIIILSLSVTSHIHLIMLSSAWCYC